jgi:hypothetical protein
LLTLGLIIYNDTMSDIVAGCFSVPADVVRRIADDLLDHLEKWVGYRGGAGISKTVFALLHSKCRF